MNIPTRLTFLRMFMIPAFIAVFFIEFTGYRFVAAAIFAAACFTDFLDGFLARRWKQVTTLGKFLDPIADKLLVACALIAVSMEPPFAPIRPIFQTMTGIATMIILMRELFVSGFRIVASSKNVILAADVWGKFKTVFQMFSMIAMIPYVSVHAVNKTAGEVFYYAGFGLLCVATFFTILSGVNYLMKNRGVLKDS